MQKIQATHNFLFNVPPNEYIQAKIQTVKPCVQFSQRLDIYFPITTHIQIHAWNNVKGAIIIRQMGKKIGRMKPSMWMIWHGSNSWQFHIFVATTYINNRTATQNAHRPERQQRKLNGESHQRCESRMFWILCFHTVCRSAWPKYKIHKWHCFIAPPDDTSCWGNHHP
jgi:hypothetical protein